MWRVGSGQAFQRNVLHQTGGPDSEITHSYIIRHTYKPGANEVTRAVVVETFLEDNNTITYLNKEEFLYTTYSWGEEVTEHTVYNNSGAETTAYTYCTEPSN